MSSLSSNISKCVSVLKTGINKGSFCKNDAKYGTYCGIHKNCVSNIVSNPVSNIISNIISNPVSPSAQIENNNANHEIYIIKLAEHIRCKDNIFKVGMTTRGVKNRLKGYPKNSQILFSTSVKDAKLCERVVLENCKKEQKLKKCDRNNKEPYKRLGNEYFEGNLRLLMKIVKTSCKKFNKLHIG
jgi:hypothetical protein